MAKEFIIDRTAGYGKRRQPTQVEKFWVCYDSKPTKTKTTRLGGIELTSILEKKPVKSTYRISTDGVSHRVKTATDVKKFIRRIRPDEAAEIDKLDAEIAALHELRRNAIRRAWDKGHVITLAEIKERNSGKWI